MFVTFYGAAREVTGSMHMIADDNDRILLDCGLFQGRRRESEAKNRVLPFDPGIITNMVLSHAHIDHSGRIPLLVKEGFNGRIVCTRATADACRYLLLDSAHIQESDAQYLNYKRVRSAMSHMKTDAHGHPLNKKDRAGIKAILKKGRHALNLDTIGRLIAKYGLEGITPLYSAADAEAALSHFDGQPYGDPVVVGTDMTATLYDAGHILGSAITIVKTRKNGRLHTLGFSGDLGRFNKPIIKDPTLEFAEADRKIDLLILESTYGDRHHEAVGDLKPHLETVINETHQRGGVLVIPAFAYGRTQELLYLLHELYDTRAVPHLPVYVDSPLATQITRVFGEHPEVYDRDTHRTFLQKGENPFLFNQLHYVASVDESIALTRDTRPHIVIAASGMCEAGRILHHLRYRMHDPRNTILIVGFMAAHTLGRRILEQGEAYAASQRRGAAPELRLLNKTYPLRARVVKLGGLSAHADKVELGRFLTESNLDVRKIALVHGEADQSLAMAARLSAQGFAVTVPRAGESLPVG